MNDEKSVPSIGIGGGLKGTREWNSAVDGAPLEFTLAGLKLRVPGGTEHELKSAIVRWSPDRGVVLETVAPSTPRAAFPGPVNAGVRLEEVDQHGLSGILAGGVGVSAGYVIPTASEDQFGIPRKTRTIEGDLLQLRVGFLKFEEATQPRSLAIAVREGILKCFPDLPYGEYEHVKQESSYGGSSNTALIVATGELAGGYHFFLRRTSDRHVQCRVTGPDDGRIEEVSRILTLALALVTGAHCRWISWQQETQLRASIVLGEPQHDPSVRFPLMRRGVDYEDFKKFVRCVSEAHSKDPVLYKKLSLPELAWPPKETYAEIVALLSAAVAEALLSAFYEFLPGTGSVKPVDEEKLKSFETLLGQEPFSDHPLTPRVIGALKMFRQIRATDVLYAVREASPLLVLEEEVKAWQSLRNPAAHGKFDANSPDFFRKVGLVSNLIHKVIMRAVGYEGQFVDYSTIGWAVNRFGAA